MILDCQGVSKSFGTNEILKHISFHLEEKEKMAIVGSNGAGKTTLLKIIMREEEADAGQVVLAKDAAVGYLSQHQDVCADGTVYGVMKDAVKPILDLQAKLRQLELDMTVLSGKELERALDAYNRYTNDFEYKNGYACESEITGVLKGLGFSPEDFDRRTDTLSGGQKTRLALGRLLLAKPDLILLDEPTNHLDMDSVRFLENFLAGYCGSVILVSHDRYFLDKIATKVVELDQGKSAVYPGGYTYYSEKRAAIRESMRKAYLNQQAEIRHQEAVITKLKQFNREKSVKRAESREKMLSRVERIEKPAESHDDMRLRLEPAVVSGEDVLTIEGLSKTYPSCALFTGLSMKIKRGEHVALIGGNGAGKTTILKIISKQVSKDEGTVVLGSKVTLGYYDQEHQLLHGDNTIFEEISDAYPALTNTKIRNVLAAFLFTGEDVFKKISDLSGGEKGRVSLAKLMLSSANFLILDEPTNHLDITSKEILEEAIRTYTGTVLLVSHDRYFINRTATRILELKNKKLTSYIGNYDYYESHRAAEQDAGTRPFAPVSDTNTPSASAAPSSAKQAWKENKAEQARLRKKANDLKKLEDTIGQYENRISEIDAEFRNPEIGTNASRLNELTAERESAETELSALYDAWETLSES